VRRKIKQREEVLGKTLTPEWSGKVKDRKKDECLQAKTSQAGGTNL